MLRAVQEQLTAAYPDATLTMAPTAARGDQPFRKVVDSGLYPKASLYWKGRQWGRLAGLAPRKIREMYGVVLDREVDVVVDAAGFAHSDQWGVASTRELAQAVRRWKRQGTKIILLPQAFGPFSDQRIRHYMRKVVDYVDLIIPRDRISYEHLTGVVGARPNIRQYPDFTNLINGVLPPGFDAEAHRVCLVPNHRMIEKAREDVGASYLPFMIKCAKYLVAKNACPFILVHEGPKDREIAEHISQESGGVPVLIVDDPLEIKGVLGASYATIGSRFHGLVSALSQGVPSIATGWSHKYGELFRDYEFLEGVVQVSGPEADIYALIDRVIDEESNALLRVSLLEKSEELKKRSRAMWEEVFGIISGTPSRVGSEAAMDGLAVK